MMWNQNDTKYIIKRLILYILISCIVFFGAQRCAQARVETRYWCSNNSSTTPCDTFFQQSEMTKYPPLYYMGNNTPFFQNYEQGYVLFSLVAFYGTAAGTQQYIGLYSATLRTYGGYSGQYGVYTCDIGNIGSYKDNTTHYDVFSVKCPVQTTSNWYLYDLALTKYGQTEMYVRRSETITYVSDASDADAIISAQQQAAQNQITSINNMSSSMQAALGTHATNIINSMNTATQQEISAINAATQATQDNTAAINAQTQWQQQDFQFDSSWADSLNLFGNDTNYIRQLLLWPFNFSLVIGQSLSGNACNAYTFGSLYGTQITLPCINWKNYVGNTIYTAIDTIMGMVILFGVITYIRKVFEYLFSFGGKAFETVGVEVFR